jgi:hypothetical protein
LDAAHLSYGCVVLDLMYSQRVDIAWARQAVIYSNCKLREVLLVVGWYPIRLPKIWHCRSCDCRRDQRPVALFSGLTGASSGALLVCRSGFDHYVVCNSAHGILGARSMAIWFRDYAHLIASNCSP